MKRQAPKLKTHQSAEREAARARELSRESLRKWTDWVFENGSYKLVALFVTLILWVTILGRRDFQLSKDMELEFLLPQNLTVANQAVERKVTVKVSGPRMALKKFSTNPGSITVDLVRSQAGPVRALITPRNVEVPFGVKVISINPDVVNLTLAAVGNDESENSANVDQMRAHVLPKPPPAKSDRRSQPSAQ